VQAVRAYGRRVLSAVPSARRSGLARFVLLGGGATAVVAAGLGVLVVAALSGSSPPAGSCTGPVSAIAVAVSAGVSGTGSAQPVGATEYGGPGDPSSGTVGASGQSLLAHPDSYAELGGITFQTATAMGGLPYLTPLRVSWNGRSAVAYKRDFGLGGAPIDGLPRVIDLWWQFAGALRIPYEGGRWSGAVRVSRPPDAGAGAVLGQAPATVVATASPAAAGATGGGLGLAGPCATAAPTAAGVPLSSGSRAQTMPDGEASAPAAAPA
jgi:hypothetical protein